MTRKVYVVTDLGSGDGGKGSVVHAVARSQRAHTVIKRGGAQGSHGVVSAATNQSYSTHTHAYTDIDQTGSALSKNTETPS